MNLKQVIGAMTGRFGPLPHPEHADLVRKAAAEGIVLLKNNGVLPLRSRKAALFGAGAVDTIICGTGSGYVCAPYVVTVKKGLENAGFAITSTSWLKRFAAESRETNRKDKTLTMLDRRWSGKTILIDEPLITDQELQEAKAAETAIYVIRRNAGEENDRTAVKGDYYLSDRERHNLEAVASAFSHTVVVLNTCVIDANFLFEIPGIDAALFIGLGGMEAGNALADVLTGKKTPCGKLTDTWAREYKDYPASATFSSNDGNTLQEDYSEDIYVGYRWFDSAGCEPLFPFGYGLSYTSFSHELLEIKADWDTVSLRVAVRNTGKARGREVVQLYISAPEGRLDKPYQELRAFGKTDPIAPGAACEIELRFATENLASFDEKNYTWIMEPGEYLFRLGSDSKNTVIAAVLDLDEEAVTRRVSDILHPDRELEKHIPARNTDTAPETALRVSLYAKDCLTKNNVSAAPRSFTTFVPAGSSYTPSAGSNPFQLPWPCEETVQTVRSCPDATFLDVCRGKVSLEEFTASLEPEVLTRIVTGTLEETPYAARDRMHRKFRLPAAPQSSGQTTAQFVRTLGIPPAYLFDGPAGVHIVGCASTSFPTGMTAAQTWDPELIRKMGRAFGRDMEHYHVTVGLTPGMNIHRDPLCGRNFEYYSEDPLLTGIVASSFTKGVQSVPGRGVSIKHFATNNQENDRYTSNNTVSTRALREIYLKGFEICVREAQPMTVMTSYNKLNGVHTSSNRELVTDLLRGEWGFEGFVMTDWGTRSEKGFDLHAGNDLIMGGYRAESLLAMMRKEAPVFEADGSVRETVRSSHFGFVKTTLTNWGSFMPEADGKDCVSTVVAAGTELGKRVLEAQEKGIAAVETNADGTRTVIWHGTERGAYLALGELQACAIRVLEGIQKSSAADEFLAVLEKKGGRK